MYEIIVNGCCLYSSDTFIEGYTKFIDCAKKYGLDNVDFKKNKEDVMTINLILKKE